MTPEQQADRWAKACIAKQGNYTTGVLAAKAKYLDHLRSHEPPRTEPGGLEQDQPVSDDGS